MLIFLIGYMACGKSTIGKKLIKQNPQLRLVDTDAMIEQRAEMTIAEIFSKHGEEYFRKMESDTLDELIAESGSCIVSTGGGLPVWGDNMERMNRAGATIYIHRTAENIASRLSPSGRKRRPKLRDLSDEELVDFMAKGIEQRDKVYREAKLTIEATTLSDKEILEIINNLVEQ